MPAALLETTKILVGTDAFRQEYSYNVNPNALKKDVVSYLGEYRFKVQKYDYELLFAPLGEESHILDVDDRVPLVTKAVRAIERRVREGKNTAREEAELQGLRSLEIQIQSAGFGDQIIWMSPPGPKSDGYGDYGFIYVGRIDRVDDSGREKHLPMSAIRVENPSLQQFNFALSLLTGSDFSFSKAEEFLASPLVVSRFLNDYEAVASYIFNLPQDSKNDSLFKKVSPLLSPYVDQFIDFVKQGKSKEFLLQAFQTIELLALDLIEEYTRAAYPRLFFVDRNAPLTFAMTHYQGIAPPAVAGSCGSTGNSSSGIQTPNIFNKFSILDDIFSSKNNHEENSCGQCGKENDGHYHCPRCNKAYADETNTPPDQRTKVCSGSLLDGQRCSFNFNC